MIPDFVGIGGRSESFGNDGESAGVEWSCARDYGGNASFRQILNLRHSFSLAVMWISDKKAKDTIYISV